MAPLQWNVLLVGGLTVASAFGPGPLLRRANRPLTVLSASNLYGPPPVEEPLSVPDAEAGTPIGGEAAEEAEPPKARVLEDELPQLKLEYELTEDLSRANTVNDEQLVRVKEFQSRLARTMEVKAQVEEMFVLEIQTVADKLDKVKASEETRKEGVQALVDRFTDVLAQKKETNDKDQEMLSQMKLTQGMLREASIKDMMDKAIEDKASLCDIETLLIAKMEECLAQLVSEVEQAEVRITKVDSVRATLPNPEDLDAVRAYTWADVETLKENLVQDSADAAAREQVIESIKAEFAVALEQRKSVLGHEAQAAIASLEGPPASTSASSKAPLPYETAQGLPRKPIADMSNSDLAEEAILASKDAGMAVVKLTASALGVVGSVVATEEFADTAGAAGAAGSSLVGVLGGLTSAFSEFNSAYKAEVEDAVDDMFLGSEPKEWVVQRAWSSAMQAGQVKDALASAGESSQLALENAVEGSKAASQLAAQTSSIVRSEEASRVSEAAAEAVESLRRGSAVFAALVQRALNVDVSKLLPPLS